LFVIARQVAGGVVVARHLAGAMGGGSLALASARAQGRKGARAQGASLDAKKKNTKGVKKPSEREVACPCGRQALRGVGRGGARPSKKKI